MASDTTEKTDAIVPSPGNFGVNMVPAEGDSDAAFEDTRAYDTGYGAYANYIHPGGGVVVLQADRFNRRLYQNKGFLFLGYTHAPGEQPVNQTPSYLGPKAEPITEEQIAAVEASIREKLAAHGVTDEAQVEQIVADSTERLRPRPVPQGQTLPGMLAYEGYNRGVAGLDPTMPAVRAGTTMQNRSLPGGYTMSVPAEAPPENGNGEPIEETAPALPKSTRRSSGTASTPTAPDPAAPAGK